MGLPSMRPTGWFQVAWSADLEVGDVKPLHYFGAELVAFRDLDGAIRVLDAHCQHIGVSSPSVDLGPPCRGAPTKTQPSASATAVPSEFEVRFRPLESRRHQLNLGFSGVSFISRVC